MTLPVTLPPEILARTLARVRRGGSALPYTLGLGFEWVEADFGRIVYRAPYREANTGLDGAMATGVLLSLVDQAGSMAAWMTGDFGNPRYFGSTVKTQLDRFEPAVREDVLGEGQVLSIQGELVHSVVRLTTANGRVLGHGSTIYRIADRGER